MSSRRLLNGPTAHPDERSEEGSQMKNQKGYFYILTNKRKNVLYAGSTKDLVNRIRQHRKGYQKGFTQKYKVNRLICYEVLESIGKAKKRERQVKGWIRTKKFELIEKNNKQWKDLYNDVLRDPSLRSG